MKIRDLINLLNTFDENKTVVFSDHNSETDDNDPNLIGIDGVESIRCFHSEYDEIVNVVCIYKKQG